MCQAGGAMWVRGGSNVEGTAQAAVIQVGSEAAQGPPVATSFSHCCQITAGSCLAGGSVGGGSGGRCVD
jgi:hypothetical protein